MENNKVYVSKKVIGDVCSDDVTYELQDKFGFDYEKHESFVEIPRSFGKANTEPIDINQPIKILNDLKEKGSSHVQIFYDEGHREYIFSGIKIELADDGLIDRYEKYQEKHFKINKEILDLYKKIGLLQKELDSID